MVWVPSTSSRSCRGVALELSEAEGATALTICAATEALDDCAETPRAEVSRLGFWFDVLELTRSGEKDYRHEHDGLVSWS